MANTLAYGAAQAQSRHHGWQGSVDTVFSIIFVLQTDAEWLAIYSRGGETPAGGRAW